MGQDVLDTLCEPAECEVQRSWDHDDAEERSGQSREGSISVVLCVPTSWANSESGYFK